MNTQFKLIVALLLIFREGTCLGQSTAENGSNQELLQQATNILAERNIYRDSVSKLQMKNVRNSAELDEMKTNLFLSQTNEYAKYRDLSAVLKTNSIKAETAFKQFLNSLNDTVNVKFKLRYSKFNATKRTIITKIFAADQVAKLILTNRFGKITLNNWTNKDIKVIAEINGYSSTEDRAATTVSKARVNTSLVNRVANINTIFDIITQGNGLQVNYTIYAPETLKVEIKNKYGGVNIGAYYAPVDITTEFGDVIADKLANPLNLVKITFGSLIANAFSGDLVLSHASANIAETWKLNLTADYSPVNIGKTSGDCIMNVKFGKEININSVSTNTKRIAITASFVAINFGPDPASNFNVEMIGKRLNYRSTSKLAVSSSKRTKANNNLYTCKAKYGKESDTDVVIQVTDCVVAFF